MVRLVAYSLCMLFVSPLVRADEPQEKAKQEVITIGPKTTAITTPLDDEGFVDYVAAVNERASKGVTVENNWEVVVRRVMGPQEIGEFMRAEYHAAIGIPVPPADGEYFQSFYAFGIEHFGGDDNERAEKTQATAEEIGDRPWKQSDFPVAAKWLKSQQKHLDALVEGSKRPENYTPYLAGHDEEDEEYPRLIAILLPSVQQQRSIARALRYRAMNHLGEGRIDEAWVDVQALHRIARHSGAGFSLIEGLVGIAIDSMAFDVEVLIVQSEKLTDAQLRRFRAEHAKLPRLVSMADQIDIGERWMGLDAVHWLASDPGGLPNLMKNLSLINALSMSVPPEEVAGSFVAFDDKPQPRPKDYTIDWDETLMLMNGWYDRLAAAAREPDPAKRSGAFDKIDQDLKGIRADVTDAKQILIRLTSGKPRKEMGRIVGNLLVSLLLPATRGARTAEDRAVAHRDLVDLAFAMETHRRRTGAFPKDLDDLRPTELESIPEDPSFGDPYFYRRAGNGYVLYGIGRNQKDDGGRDQSDATAAGSDDGWDDIVLKVERN